MKKILAFSGSSSSKSINQQLVKHVASFVKDNKVTEIDLRDYPLPLFSIDIEEKEGIPQNAHKLKELFDAHDGFIIALPEHNTSMTAFFKNTIDWLSRIKVSFFEHKPIVLLSTSPGPGGGRSVLAQAEPVLSGYLAGKVIGKSGLAKFYDNVEMNGSIIQIKDEEVRNTIKGLIKQLENELK
ncbi:MAG: NAD(P)H-dependent oxidoreductase [Bacteroidetes bacterium]|nr:NAD(P)H-dependent oxidoreductase [Bacteroidota bacterium]